MNKSIFKITYIFPDDILVNILGFIKQNGPMILSYDFKQKKFIDTEHPDYTRDKILVQQNGYALKYVSYDLQTEEICKLAVQENGNVLQYVSYDLQTEEICKLAVQQNGYALRYVREDLLTHEMCKLAGKLAVQENWMSFKERIYRHMSTKNSPKNII